jgi:hypothetical protein
MVIGAAANAIWSKQASWLSRRVHPLFPRLQWCLALAHCGIQQRHLFGCAYHATKLGDPSSGWARKSPHSSTSRDKIYALLFSFQACSYFHCSISWPRNWIQLLEVLHHLLWVFDASTIKKKGILDRISPYKNMILYTGMLLDRICAWNLYLNLWSPQYCCSCSLQFDLAGSSWGWQASQ